MTKNATASHTRVPPVQNNQPGTGFGSRGKSVGLVLSVTPLGWLPAPRIDARGVIWAHIQILPPRCPRPRPAYCPSITFVVVIDLSLRPLMLLLLLLLLLSFMLLLYSSTFFLR